jgi:spermidine synthase
VQLEEEIQEDLKWSILVKEKLYSGKSDFQSVELVESGPFGKASSHCPPASLPAIILD